MFRFVLILLVGMSLGRFVTLLIEERTGQTSTLDKDEENILRALKTSKRVLAIASRKAERVKTALKEPTNAQNEQPASKMRLSGKNAPERHTERLETIDTESGERFSQIKRPSRRVVLRPGELFDPESGLIVGVVSTRGEPTVILR